MRERTADFIARVDALTVDAYSRRRYASWTACIKALRAALHGTGLSNNEKALAEFLNSKHMRWAADSANRQVATATDLRNYIRAGTNLRHGLAAEVRALLGEEAKA